jgi:hypothetical protein
LSIVLDMDKIKRITNRTQFSKKSCEIFLSKTAMPCYNGRSI